MRLKWGFRVFVEPPRVNVLRNSIINYGQIIDRYNAGAQNITYFLHWATNLIFFRKFYTLITVQNYFEIWSLTIMSNESRGMISSDIFQVYMKSLARSIYYFPPIFCKRWNFISLQKSQTSFSIILISLNFFQSC